MLVLKKGVSGINVKELNELYQLNAPDENRPLTEAFDWNKTKEGYQFWSFVNSIAAVSKEVDKIKEQLKTLPEPFGFLVGRELDRVERNKAKTLRFAFKWGETPQGEAYWHLVSELIKFYSPEVRTGAVMEYQPSVNNGLKAQAAHS